MSKKVLHILATNKYSGAENVVCQIIDAFKNNKEFEMVYCSPEGEIESVLKEKNIGYLPIVKLNIANIRKAIQVYQPDIIHAHDFRASLIAASVKKNQKIISHLHNNPPFIKKWGLKSIIYNLAKNKFDEILVVSKAVQEEAVFLKNVKKAVTIVNNCINEEEVLEKAKQYEVKEDYDIAFVGRLTLQKNPIKLVDIIKKINESIPGIKAVIIGDGEEKENLEKYIKENKLENVIEMKGFLKNPFPYLKKSKVALMPSIFEGFGLVAIECLICGVPVLNSGVGGLATIFESETYYICDSIEEYANKAIDIISSKKKYEFDSILNKYTDIEKWKENFEQAYGESEKMR